jgi:hypothetical protein
MKDYLGDFLTEAGPKNLEGHRGTYHQNHQKADTKVAFEGFEGSPPIDPWKFLPPCALCGRRDRWDHHGIWRCVACWPAEAF